MRSSKRFSRLAAVRSLRLTISLLATTLVLGAAIPAAAAARVPQGFVGMMISGPMLWSGTNMSGQMGKMEASGVESVRAVFAWSDAQPYANWSQVPAAKTSQFQGNPVPTNYSETDRIVYAAAQHGLRLLPVVVYTPPWDAMTPAPGGLPQPQTDGPYASYLTLLIKRYGPHGTFWALHPKLPKVPIRMWQIWNEPDGLYYWTDQPFAKTYVALLKATHTAIKRADPGAKVVLGGMSNYSWKNLAQIYKVPGARSAFDIAAIHPYTQQPQGIITILDYARTVMNENGDRHKPLMATEIGWPSSKGQTPQDPGFATTEQGQASKLAQLFPLLLENRQRLNLAGIDYYTWADNETRGGWYFDFAGLFRVHGGRFHTKPAYNVFRREALSSESCRVKGPVATVCVKR
jgi:polysaccharide biosynthesis protein PslG